MMYLAINSELQPCSKQLYIIKTLAQIQRLRHHLNFIASQSYPQKSL